MFIECRIFCAQNHGSKINKSSGFPLLLQLMVDLLGLFYDETDTLLGFFIWQFAMFYIQSSKKQISKKIIFKLIKSGLE